MREKDKMRTNNVKKIQGFYFLLEVIQQTSKKKYYTQMLFVLNHTLFPIEIFSNTVSKYQYPSKPLPILLF